MQHRDLDEVLAVDARILETEIKRRVEIVGLLEEIARRSLARAQVARRELEETQRLLAAVRQGALTRSAEASDALGRGGLHEA